MRTSIVLSVSIEGDIVGKGRPRFVRATGRTYTPEHTRAWEKRAADVFASAWGDKPALHGPVIVRLNAVKARRQKDRHSARVLRTVKPDLDNVVKATLDAMERAGVIIGDQVVSGLIAYSWLAARGEGPCVEVIVEEVDETAE